MGMADPETGHKGVPEKIVRARSGALLVLILQFYDLTFGFKNQVSEPRNLI
jgi:hypothetical protein